LKILKKLTEEKSATSEEGKLNEKKPRGTQSSSTQIIFRFQVTNFITDDNEYVNTYTALDLENMYIQKQNEREREKYRKTVKIRLIDRRKIITLQWRKREREREREGERKRDRGREGGESLFMLRTFKPP
jgi:hypothetical protein